MLVIYCCSSYTADVGRQVDTGSAQWPASVSSSVESSVGVKWICAVCAMQYMCACVWVCWLWRKGGGGGRARAEKERLAGEIVAAAREFLECSSRQTDRQHQLPPT